MKYGSKKEAKKWSMDTLRGGLVATIPTPFHDDTLEVHEKVSARAGASLRA
jgi:hypothetical protein